MEIRCPECDRRFLIPDEKIPKNKRVTLSCPGCKGRIPLDTKQDMDESDSASPARENEIEFFEEGVKKAVVCVSDSDMKEEVLEALTQLDYRISQAADFRSFLLKLRYNPYDLAVISEKIGDRELEGNPILKYIERLPMTTRRNMFVLLISDQLRSLDSLRAFSLSVDAIVHSNDIGNIREILRKALIQNEQLYRVFKECLRTCRNA